MLWWVWAGGLFKLRAGLLAPSFTCLCRPLLSWQNPRDSRVFTYLKPVFAANLAATPTIKWQYFGTQSGMFNILPAKARSNCNDYDPRVCTTRLRVCSTEHGARRAPVVSTLGLRLLSSRCPLFGLCCQTLVQHTAVPALVCGRGLQGPQGRRDRHRLLWEHGDTEWQQHPHGACQGVCCGGEKYTLHPCTHLNRPYLRALPGSTSDSLWWEL